jgi:hypothetical protein
MSISLSSFIQRDALDPRAPAGDLTHVDLTFRPGRIEHWLRFGKPVSWTVLDRKRSIASFRPGQILAFVRWAANDHGTIISRLDILRTIDRKEAYQTLPFVRPGGEILLRLDKWRRVEQAFRIIGQIEIAGIDPCDVSPAYWRHVHNRLVADQEPRPYTPVRHRAWMLRRKIHP